MAKLRIRMVKTVDDASTGHVSPDDAIRVARVFDAQSHADIFGRPVEALAYSDSQLVLWLSGGCAVIECSRPGNATACLTPNPVVNRAVLACDLVPTTLKWREGLSFDWDRRKLASAIHGARLIRVTQSDGLVYLDLSEPAQEVMVSCLLDIDSENALLFWH